MNVIDRNFSELVQEINSLSETASRPKRAKAVRTFSTVSGTGVGWTRSRVFSSR